MRDLADLGGGSRALGERWEQVGGALADRLVGRDLTAPSGETYRCRAVLRLDQQAALLRESSGRGLKSPDCLFAGADRLGRLVVQPGDFKFTLDIASRDQIDPAPIRALLEGGGPLFVAALGGLLSEAAAELPPGSDPAGWLLAALDGSRARLLPGFFLAPDEPSNRLFLRQTARRRRGGLTEQDVRFLPVEPAAFFAGLPGLEVAPILRRCDGVAPGQQDFPIVTYYFQLSAAVRGAFLFLQRPLLSLLGPDPELDLPRLLGAFLARRPAMWAIDVARDLASPAIFRREQTRLAQRLAGSPLRGRVAYEAAEATGWQIGDEAGPGVVARSDFRLLLDQIEEAHAARLADRLAARLAAGPFADDRAVIAWLQETRPALEEQARADLVRLLAGNPVGA